MNTEPPLLFALSETEDLGARIASALATALASHEERDFEDGEHKIRPLEGVRDRDVFVIQSLHGGPKLGVNDKLCRLLFFIGALRDAGAARVTAVLPYLCYARKDRKTKSRDPVTTRYLAQLFEAVGTDRVAALDVHNPAAFQNAFRCRSEHLSARALFVEHLVPLAQGKPLTVVSPDTGGAKRAEAFRHTLAERTGRPVGSAFLEKHRSGGEVSGTAVVGEVDAGVAIIIDDLISTGGTMQRAAEACRQRGATAVYAVATHGIFVGDADAVLADAVLDGVIVTNSIPPFRLAGGAVQDRLTVLDVAPLLGELIRRLHGGGSLDDFR